MRDPSRFLSRFFNLLTKSRGNRKKSRLQYPAALPSASKMGDPSHFFSRFFNLLTKTRGNKKSEINPAALPEELLRQFSLAEIKAATNNFHEDFIIGEGGFGPIYKGFFYDVNLVVAVKRFAPESHQGFSEFLTEVQLLCQLRHQHLISLIGFCNDKGEMILVYEHMRNGSLRDHLYGCGYDPLPWKQRLEICIAAARGLHYLHSGAKQAVIHRDIKSSNILLDDEWVCKVSDFRLSKMRSRSKSKALEKIESLVRGTIGYMAPEYALWGELTEKADVYSFGIVLFEVLCARKVYDERLEENQRGLLDFACESIGGGTVYNIIDPYLKGRIAPECFRIFVEIAYSCICCKGNRRPEMGEVEVMLERALELQEKADSDMLHLASNGEYMYEEESFCAVVLELQEKTDSDMLHLASNGEYMYEDESFCAVFPYHISDVESDMDSSSSFNRTE